MTDVRQQANEIAEKLAQVGKPQPEAPKQAMSAAQLQARQQAMIKGVRITQSAQQITNKDASRSHGEQYNLKIGPFDGTGNIPDTKWVSRIKIKGPAAGQLNPVMYNLPDVRSVFKVDFCKLNNRELRNSGTNSHMDRATYLALMSRVRPAKLARNLVLDSYSDLHQKGVSLSQQSGYLVPNETGSMSAVASDTTANQPPSVAKLSELNQNFQENKLYDVTGGNPGLLPNLSTQAIQNDTQKRLYQAQKHYRIVQGAVGNTDTKEEALKFESLVVTDGDSQADGEHQDYYAIRLGDLIPELEGFKSFYMGGNVFEIGITILNKQECLTPLRKPITQRALLNGTQTQTEKIAFADTSMAPIDYNDYKLIISDTYLMMKHLLISDSDKLAFKDIQNMIGVPLNRYTYFTKSITSDGAETMQNNVNTKNLIGAVIFFRSKESQHNSTPIIMGENGTNNSKNDQVKLTDFTHDLALKGNYGHQINHDHPCLPVDEIQWRVGGEDYTMSTPPVKNQTYFQYIQAMEGASCVLGAGNAYDVSFNEWRSNKCAHFIPFGKDHSGINVEGKQVEVTIKFQKEDNLSFVQQHRQTAAEDVAITVKDGAVFTQAGSAHFNRDVKQYNVCVLYVHKDMVRFDKGFTELS